MMKFLFYFTCTLMLFGLGNAAAPSQESTNPKEVSNALAAASFESFSGKIIKNRVRMRCRPGLDGHIVRELKKNDFVLVTGQEGDFWIISPPEDMRFFVFRSYIIDNTVEANRINIRLSPDTESPIIGQLMHGDHVEGEIAAADHKWLEIKPPNNVHFFVAKEFVDKAGDVEYFSQIQARKKEGESLLQSAYSLAQEECKKPFNEMSLDEPTQKFESILHGYTDFPEYIRQAKEGLALVQDNYLQKKLSFLETKMDLPQNVTYKETNATPPAKTELAIKKQPTQPKSPAATTAAKCAVITKKMSSWLAVEEGLFSAWRQLNADKDIAQFYREQEINGQTLSGVVEPYDSTLIKDPPGDFLLKTESSEVAILYSTRVDLNPYIGKKVSLKASPRSNNSFAFPAYFVTSIDQ